MCEVLCEVLSKAFRGTNGVGGILGEVLLSAMAFNGVGGIMNGV